MAFLFELFFEVRYFFLFGCQLIDAALAQLHLRNVEKVNGVFLQKLKPQITLKKVMSMRIKNVCARRLPDTLRMEIDGHLETLSGQELRQLFRRPGRVHLITELYFGELKLYLEKEYSAELEAVVSEKKLPVTLANEGDYINEYDFETPTVPFAYRIEPLKNFNG